MQMRSNLRRGTTYLTLAGVGFLFVAPLVWMVSTSFMTLDQVGQWPPQWLPDPFTVENYPNALMSWDFGRSFANTATITAWSIAGDLISSTLVAYGFARFRFPGRNILFVILLATLMLPFIVTLIPLYIGFSRLNWINTFLPLIVPHFFGNAFFIFLLRQFFMAIPQDLVDAARLDGASELVIWWRIMVPLARPALIVVAILSFQTNWNDFLGPLLYLQQDNLQTLSLGLYRFNTLPGEASLTNQLMAATVIMVIPVVIVFAIFQKQFVQGVTLSGLKG